MRIGKRLNLAAMPAMAVATALMAAQAAAASEHDCLVEAKTQLKIATPIAGVIERVMVDRGARIREGDELARLQSGVEEAAVRIGRVKAASDALIRSKHERIAFLERRRQRAQTLRTNAYIAESSFDEIETDLRVARQDLREAEMNQELAREELNRAEEVLRQRTIRSPIDGIVVERHLGRGEYAYEQAPVLTLARLHPLNVEVYLPVALYEHIRLGMKAEVTLQAPIGGTHQAEVEIVDRVLDARSGTFGVRLSLPNEDYRLPAGLHCRIRFPTS